MVQYIVVAAEEMIGEISFIYDPSWMIINDSATSQHHQIDLLD